jgi:hypothetical protein
MIDPCIFGAPSMKIYVEKDPVQNRWWVHMDLWMASFRSLDGAESFVERLNSRINAPHSLEMITNRPLWSGTISYSPPLDHHDGPHSAKPHSQA